MQGFPVHFSHIFILVLLSLVPNSPVTGFSHKSFVHVLRSEITDCYWVDPDDKPVAEKGTINITKISPFFLNQDFAFVDKKILFLD